MRYPNGSEQSAKYIRGFGRMSGRVNGPGERDED